MKQLAEALSKSMIKKIEKHTDYYIVWPGFLYKEYEPYKIECYKGDRFYPALYILPEKLTDKFKSKHKYDEFIIYTVKPSFGDIHKFKDEFKKGNIYMEWDTNNDVNELDVVYDNTEK